jgi:hypothetical protein
MVKEKNTGRNPTPRELADVDRWSAYPLSQNPSAIPTDHARLSHINTYGELPDYYVDRAFTCRRCGKREIWRSADQKWYCEEAKGHIDARAVECHDCRTKKK